MSQITIDEAREKLDEVTARYRDIEQALAETIPGETTPERVVRSVELQGALHDVAQDLIATRDLYNRLSKETADRRRERATTELAKVEAELVDAVSTSEQDIEKLASSLARVLDLSKQRYAYRQEATGRAPRSLLARGAVHGWLTWRLQRLELPDLDHPSQHYRAPLDELLGLNTNLDEEKS